MARTAKPIGRNVVVTTLRPRTGKPGQFVLTVKGDRGEIRLYLTEAEVREQFFKEAWTPEAERDTLSFNLKLEPGTLSAMLTSCNLTERRA